MNYSHNYYKSYPSKRRPRKKFTFMLVGFIFAVVGLIYSLSLQKEKNQRVSYISPLLAASNSSPKTPSLTVNPTFKLKGIIEKTLADYQGKMSIVVEDIKNGEVYLSNAHEIFPSASLYKLWIMATTYQQIQNGQLKEDQVLSDSIANLNATFTIDPENAEQTEGRITQSVNESLEKMITVSDNYSAMLLTKKIKLSNVAAFLTGQSLNESKVGTDGSDPATSAYDIALFFEKLYHKELANEEYTNKMLALLKGQRINNKLPKYLPSGTVVAHKTGELGTSTHDGGIIYSPKGTYILTILADNAVPADAEETIAQLSKVVYTYFNQ